MLPQSITCWAVIAHQTPNNAKATALTIADRNSDAAKATLATQQIEVALGTMRDGGHAPDAAFYEAQLPKARALLDRLASRGQ